MALLHGSSIINVDLSWNPAVLEQRIARAHRMGQKRPVHAYVLVTEERREKVAAGSGELLGAALNLVSQLLDSGQSPAPASVVEQMSTNLASCVERDEQGRPQLRLTLPDEDSLKSLAKTLAQLLTK